MDFIMAVTVEQGQVSRRVVVVIAVPVMDFKVVFD
jgi:hypothetical protein